MVWAFSWTIPLLALFALLLWLWPTPVPAQANDKITLDLQAALAGSEAGDLLRFIARLQAASDFSRIPPATDKLERRALMVQQLQQTAESSQAPLLAELNNWQANGRISHYRPLWIIDAIAIEGTADLIEQITARPEVKQIELDNIIDLITH